MGNKMDLFEIEKPLVGDPSRVYLLKRALDLSNSGTRVLDVGCGTCSLWEPIIGKWKFELWGIDIDEEKIEMGKKVVKDKGRIRVGDVHNLSKIFSTSFFDIVVSTQVFYLIEDLKKVLQEINFVLKPGGKLLFTTELPKSHQPLLSRLLHSYTKIKGYVKKIDIPKRQDEKELSALLEEANFEVGDVRFYHIPPLKFIHNNIVSEENKNRVLRKWVELEEELIRDANFMAKGKVYCRNLFMDAVKREYK